MMMTAIPWWTKTGPLWYPYHGKDLWTRMKRVRSRLGRKDTGRFGKTCAIQSQDVVMTNPNQAGSIKSCEKLSSRRNHRDETETSAHQSETKTRDHSTERVTGAELRTHSLLPLPTTWTCGERVSEPSTEGHPSIFSQDFLFARRCFCTSA